MRKLLVEVMSDEEATKRMIRAWNEASAGKPVRTSTIAFGSMVELGALFSHKRMQLLQYVARHPGLSIRAIARALERDYKNVHTDVLELESNYVLQRGKTGLVTTPYDEIIIRAPLRKAA